MKQGLGSYVNGIKALGLLMVGFLGGCATAQSPDSPTAATPIVQDMVFTGTYDVVWKNVVDTLVSLGWSMRSTDKSSGLLTTDQMQTQLPGSWGANKKQYGLGPEGYGYAVNMEMTSLTVTVTEEARGIKVRLKPHIEEVVTGQYARKYTLPSNGKLEAEIFRALTEKLRPASADVDSAL